MPSTFTSPPLAITGAVIAAADINVFRDNDNWFNQLVPQPTASSQWPQSSSTIAAAWVDRATAVLAAIGYAPVNRAGDLGLSGALGWGSSTYLTATNPNLLYLVSGQNIYLVDAANPGAPVATIDIVNKTFTWGGSLALTTGITASAATLTGALNAASATLSGALAALTVNAGTGGVNTSGDVAGVKGTFSGAVSGTSATFSSTVTGGAWAGGSTLAGALNALTVTAGTGGLNSTGDVGAVKGVFSGAVSGTTGTFTSTVTGGAWAGGSTAAGALNALVVNAGTSGVSSAGPVSGTTGTFSGALAALSAAITNAITAATLTLTGLCKALTFESTVAPGTAPLVVASDTKVVNLNADKLDDLDSTAFARFTPSNFSGNNGSARQIATGFRCKYVRISVVNGTGRALFDLVSTTAGDNIAVSGTSTALFTVMTQTKLHASDGFIVDVADASNASGALYYYEAFG